MKRQLKRRQWIGIISSICLISIGMWLVRPLDRAQVVSIPSMSVKITDRHGIVLREILSAEGGRNTWLTFEELPQHVINAVISAEDKRFFAHHGVDVLAVGRAVFQNLRGQRVVSGASTITQQVIKLRFSYPRTVWGKIREMLMAIRLERTLSKQEILTQYLNRVEFSNLAFGIEAAAQLYFRKPAQHLSLAESVFLAGIIQAPSRMNPYRNFERALQRQRQLLERMTRNKLITEPEVRMAQRERILITPKTANFKAPHFCEMLLTGKTIGLHKENVIQTTLDSYLQERIEAILAARLSELANYHVTNAAVLVLDNRNGDILAYVGSRDFFDETIQGQVDGVRALRQPGSALKPFTYQLALERSYTPATLIPDIKDYPAAPRSFLPENYDRQFHGPVRLRQALACSYNIPAVRVLENIGIDVLYDRLHAFGFDSLREVPSFYGPGLTLGNGEVTLLELTRAFAILARRGQAFHEQYLFESNSQKTEQNVTLPQLFAPQAIYLLTHILADRQAAVPAFGEDSPLKLPFLTAVKTGTSKDYRDNWTIGYTSEYTVGVWTGNFDGSSMQKVSGISGAAPIYRDVMLSLYRYHDPPSLLADPPDGIVSARICPVSGKLVGDDCPHALDELFLAGTEPTETCDMHRAYWVDDRDGLLTDPTSPHALKKVFLLFPPEYQTWARTMGYPLPPTQYSPDAVVSQERRFDAGQTIHIVRPHDGDVYAIDPILRREYQTVQLSAVVPPEIKRVTWYVNDGVWNTVAPPFQTAWRLSPGTHRIYVTAEQQGRILHSPEITVYVIE